MLFTKQKLALHLLGNQVRFSSEFVHLPHSLKNGYQPKKMNIRCHLIKIIRQITQIKL